MQEKCAKQSRTAPAHLSYTSTSRRKSGKLFFDLVLGGKESKTYSRHSSMTLLFFSGDRNVQEECAKRIPTALALLSFRGVLLFLLFFIRSTRKLVVAPPMTVDLSLVVAAVTLAPCCLTSLLVSL